MSIIQRKINLSIKLATNTGTNQPNTFAESGTNTVNISGLRTIVRITNSGTPQGCTAQVKIYGLTESLMNQLSTLGMTLNIIRKNTLLIEAGDATNGMSTVFLGTIQQAYADYSNQPEVPFQIEALLGLFESTAPAPPSSFTGSSSVENIMSGLARSMGLGFKNNGVNAQLSSPYFSGSLWDQAEQCAQHAGIEWGVFGASLEIWPRGGNRQSQNIPTLSPATSSIAYPAFTQQGLIISTVFRPELSFGSLVKVESSLLTGIAGVRPEANFPTQWAIYKLDLALDQEVPGGEWRATAYCYNPNSSSPILPPVK